MDYSKLSDAQLLALHTNDFSKLSNEELVQLHQASQPAPEEGLGEYVGRGVTAAIPVVAGAAGGMAASALGPLGSVAGAGLGYAGGKELERLANHYAFGDKLADEAPVDEVKRVGTNVLQGGAAEAGGQVLSKVAEPVVNAAKPYTDQVRNYLSDKFGNAAENLAIAHLRPTAAVARDLGQEGLHDAAREALDSGSVGFGAKVGATADRLADARDAAGAVKGDIVNASDAEINPNDIASRVENEVVAPLRQTAETQPLADTIQKKADALREQYMTDLNPDESVMTPAQLEAEKMKVQNNTNYGANSSEANKTMGDYGRVLKEGVENAVADPAFPAAKRAYANLDNAAGMAERTATTHGLTGKLVDVELGVDALKDAARGNPLGPIIAGARALTKGRAASAGAVALDTVSKVLSTAPEALGQYAPVLRSAAARGNAAFATTNYLLQQSDPGFQQIMRQVAEDPQHQK